MGAIRNLWGIRRPWDKARPGAQKGGSGGPWGVRRSVRGVPGALLRVSLAQEGHGILCPLRLRPEGCGLRTPGGATCVNLYGLGCGTNFTVQ